MSSTNINRQKEDRMRNNKTYVELLYRRDTTFSKKAKWFIPMKPYVSLDCSSLKIKKLDGRLAMVNMVWEGIHFMNEEDKNATGFIIHKNKEIKHIYILSTEKLKVHISEGYLNHSKYWDSMIEWKNA